MTDGERLIRWLSQTAKEARVASGRKPHHIAAAIDVDPTTIYRFESGLWPRDPDEMLAGYESVCGVPAIKLWLDALGHFESHSDSAKPGDGPETKP